MEVGDSKAKIRFKEEIANRLSSGYVPVRQYLFDNDYVQYLSREEFYNCFLNDYNEIDTMTSLEKEIDSEFRPLDNKNELFDYEFVENRYGYGNVDSGFFLIKGGKVLGLRINWYEDIPNFPYSIVKLRCLKFLSFCVIGDCKPFPHHLTDIQSLQKLDLFLDTSSQEVPNSFRRLSELRELILHTKSSSFPVNICNLYNLQILKIDNIELKTIPCSISNLSSLEVLELNYHIEVLPKSIKNLINLKRLRIWKHNLNESSKMLINSLGLKKIKHNSKNIWIFKS